ncbi:unnamed protein product [Linum trigynum]|uniref:Uncharacterized protein n=1 Tax=Linum trigynum TaxID=586398 RepID=A0AAV2FGM1_9ROSI
MLQYSLVPGNQHLKGVLGAGENLNVPNHHRGAVVADHTHEFLLLVAAALSRHAEFVKDPLLHALDGELGIRVSVSEPLPRPDPALFLLQRRPLAADEPEFVPDVLAVPVPAAPPDLPARSLALAAAGLHLLLPLGEGVDVAGLLARGLEALPDLPRLVVAVEVVAADRRVVSRRQRRMWL